MHVTFIGVGEAFDETLANTSLLVESGGTSVLLDCGFTAASAFWRTAANPLKLDALCISHFHGDHYFGIPALLVRSVEEGRTHPLTILGPYGVEERVRTLMDMAYTSVMDRAQFDMAFIECAPSSDIDLAGIRFRFAASDHSVPCLAARLDAGNESVFYSGDGRPTDATRQLAQGVSLVVHESFLLEGDAPGHGTVSAAIAFAQAVNAGMVALVHMQRTVRRQEKREIFALCGQDQGLDILLPDPGNVIALPQNNH